MNSCISQSLGACKPAQIINFDTAFTVENDIAVFDECGNKYDSSVLEYAYSLDNVCWSCYMSLDQMKEATVELTSDYFVRIKLHGNVSKITVDGIDSTEYSTQLYSGFSFGDTNESSSNIYNPYANLEGAIQLQQQLTETVGQILGIPIYYFSVNPNVGSKDITFKEYALYHVVAVKQIKLIVPDGQMPSSKPEFAEWGLDFQTDWETEIPKGMFATAFGKTAQPIEGDLIYIPMMKRMWMVASSYEEKKDSLMWNATTFKVSLTKYQQDASVDLGDSESMIADMVKNKYEDIFGNDENIASSSSAAAIIPNNADNLYPVYMSDEMRKYMTCDFINVNQESTYYKGTVISDNAYSFNMSPLDASVIYQKTLCSESASVSFIASFEPINGEADIIRIGNKDVHIKQDNKGNVEISFNVENKIKSKFAAELGVWYFVSLRWSRPLNVCELLVAKYSYPENIPLYKLSNHHYYYDIDNPVARVTSRWNNEMKSIEEDPISLHGFYGKITNIKVFNYYNDNQSEILMQYPNNSHLIVNDTARQIISMDGVAIS